MSRSTAGTFLQTLDKAARDEGLSTLQHSNTGFMGEMEVRNMYRNVEEEPWAVLVRFAYTQDGKAIFTALDGSKEEFQASQEAGHDPYVHAKIEVPSHGAPDEQVAERAAQMILPAIKDAIT